jgi:Prokaryotic cytochrome b561
MSETQSAVPSNQGTADLLSLLHCERVAHNPKVLSQSRNDSTGLTLGILCYASRVSASGSLPNPGNPRHRAVVRVTHWITVIAFFALLISGAEIVISHPRFYWGEVGNALTSPLFALPIPASRSTVPTAYGYVLPDQNGWSRSCTSRPHGPRCSQASSTRSSAYGPATSGNICFQHRTTGTGALSGKSSQGIFVVRHRVRSYLC